ncbi:MAG: porin [Beijerinckiaceae bacterium]|jgi:predicted porin
MNKSLIVGAIYLSSLGFAHADELTNLKKEQELLAKQNKILIEKLASVEKRQKILETKAKQENHAGAQALAAPGPGVPPAQWTAADLGRRLLDPNDNGPLTFKGITIYGVIDAGVAYQSHGNPLSPIMPPGLEYLISKNSNHSQFTAAPNGLANSNIGIKGIEELSPGWSAVFNLQTIFNPTSGQIQNGLGSLVQNNGVALANQTSLSDSSKSGQPFANAYFGVSSPVYGTLTFGRQNTLALDAVFNYDPMGGSNAFSLIGYSGVIAGFGYTEDARLDNAIKYRVDYGPFHAGALYKFGQSGSANGDAYEGQAGVEYKGFAIDAIGSHVNDAINASSLSAANVGAVTPSMLAGAGNGLVNATVSDNTAFMLAARYTIGQFKFFGAYENIRFQDPATPLVQGDGILGGYTLDVVTNNLYIHDRVLQVFWTGVKYAVRPDVDLSVAYYHEAQNSYSGNGCSTNVAANCSGSLDAVSGLVDYHLTKRFDVYAGAMYSTVANGMANGFLNSGTIDPMVGGRFQF